jgi:hypothetical protein
MTEDPAVSTPPATSSEPTSAAPTASGAEASAMPASEPGGDIGDTGDGVGWPVDRCVEHC